jgi:hypothetical protein
MGPPADEQTTGTLPAAIRKLRRRTASAPEGRAEGARRAGEAHLQASTAATRILVAPL